MVQTREHYGAFRAGSQLSSHIQHERGILRTCGTDVPPLEAPRADVRATILTGLLLYSLGSTQEVRQSVAQPVNPNVLKMEENCQSIGALGPSWSRRHTSDLYRLSADVYRVIWDPCQPMIPFGIFAYTNTKDKVIQQAAAGKTVNSDWNPKTRNQVTEDDSKGASSTSTALTPSES